MHPSIDHSLLSPSGRVSKRAKRASDERVRRELFGDGLPFPTCPQPTAQERDLRQARRLRQMADDGMKPRTYLKEARRLEAKWANRANNPDKVSG